MVTSLASWISTIEFGWIITRGALITALSGTCEKSRRPSLHLFLIRAWTDFDLVARSGGVHCVLNPAECSIRTLRSVVIDDEHVRAVAGRIIGCTCETYPGKLGIRNTECAQVHLAEQERHGGDHVRNAEHGAARVGRIRRERSG